MQQARGSMPRKSIMALTLAALLALVAIMQWHRLGLRTTTKTTNAASRSKRYENPIRQISILGERNSGTRWTFDHLNECFGHELKVEKRLVRYKHWFQYEKPESYPHDTLVIAQFRNPYDWLKSMERVPHHSPRHLRTAAGASVQSQNSENDWRVFLTREWTMERIGLDLQMNASSSCQEDFNYRDIISCVIEPLPKEHYNYTIRYSENQPFYEMRNDGSGKPYESILELRRDKILNFLSVRDYPGVADAWVVQYEYLLQNGTQHLLHRIQEWTGVTPRCKPIGSQWKRPKLTRFVSPEFARYVRLHLNWTAEALIGYHTELVREEPAREWS